MQQLLKAAERGDKNVANGSFSKAFTAFATKCGARGVTFNPPTSTSTTSAPSPSS
jgi:hypothetical protein